MENMEQESDMSVSGGSEDWGRNPRGTKDGQWFRRGGGKERRL